MNEFEIKLDMLISSLEKKREALKSILNITDNQNLILSDRGNPAYGAMFNEMNAIKQEQIDQVIEMDSIFQGVFNGLSDGFEDRANNSKEKVARMQALISEVLELDIQIRASEQKNKAVTDEIRQAPQTKEPGQAAKSNLLKQYEKNKKPEK